MWGFDDNAVQVLQSMRPADVDMLIQKYAILLDPKSQLLPQNSQGKVCLCVCVHACVRARTCVCACVHACVCVCV